MDLHCKSSYMGIDLWTSWWWPAWEWPDTRHPTPAPGWLRRAGDVHPRPGPRSSETEPKRNIPKPTPFQFRLFRKAETDSRFAGNTFRRPETESAKHTSVSQTGASACVGMRNRVGISASAASVLSDDSRRSASACESASAFLRRPASAFLMFRVGLRRSCETGSEPKQNSVSVSRSSRN